MSDCIIKYEELKKDLEYKKDISQIKNIPTTSYPIYIIVIKKNKKKYYYTTILCNKKNFCEIISPPDENFNNVLNVISNKFKNILFWISVDVNSNNYKEKLNIFVENGFIYPYIVSKSPFKYVFNEYRVALIKKDIYNNFYKKNIFKKNNLENVMLYVEYILQQFKNRKHCNMNFKLSKKSIEYLKKSPYLSDNEYTAELYVYKIDKVDKKIIFFIDIDENTIKKGEHESVNISASKYNFHCHPKEAYLRYGVEKAWPSNSDYIGMIILKITILHFVATIEGLYIVSFTKDWCNDIDKIDKKFVEDNYKIDQHSNHTPHDYVNIINNIKYQDKPIFNVMFKKWEDIEKNNEPISINYYKEKCGNCFPIEHLNDKN